MRLTSLTDMADRSFAVHQLGCEQFGVPINLHDWLDDTAITHDEWLRYAQDVRSSYDRLGRIIGQLAGLIVLARLSGRWESDWPALITAVEQIMQTEASLRDLSVPIVARKHYAYLLAGLEKIMNVSRSFQRALSKPKAIDQALDDWTRDLTVAGAILKGIAIERLGLMPVDFSQACCNCAAAESNDRASPI